MPQPISSSGLRQLPDEHWTCSKCGQEHEGVPLDWAYNEPIYWEGPRSDRDWISEDLCVWTDDLGELHYFIRGVLRIQVVDSDEDFAYGVWSSLSKDSFDRVNELWDDPARVSEPAYFGWLSNSLPGYEETLNLPLDVLTEAVELRPALRLHDGDHALIREQREGITAARVREIAELGFHQV
jgi:hypothetical protein